MALNEKEAAVVSSALRLPVKKGRKLVARTMDDAEGGWKKILAQGHSGTGKTRAIAEILQTNNREGNPTKVFVASTDIGGNGLASVEDRLRAVGKPELMKNIANVDFDTYEDFSAFVTGSLVPELDGKSLWDWNPDVLVHDGFANFQESHIWRYVLDIDPISKESNEARDEGIQAGMVEWGQIRRASLLSIDLFNRMHNPVTGKRLSKVVTVLMDDGKEDKLTHETKRGPLVLGAARAYMAAAFDYVITFRASVKPGLGVAYTLDCNVGSNTVAKQRGGEFNKMDPKALATADFKALWEGFTK